jgi:uncharacterized protein (DUF3084 family)
MALRLLFTELPNIQFASDMKKIFIIFTVISFAMICSCQKQVSVAEQQLAQRKVELDARETALDERDKDLSLRETALRERENALAKKEKVAVNVPTTAPVVQSQDAIRDAAQAKAERDRRLQQLPPELRALVPNPSTAEKDRLTKERLSEAQGALKELMNQKQPRSQVPGAAGFPATEAASPTSSPAPQ